ncbi:hypothetical protein [Sorangium sp. So ce1078]|uniref:hypothetical protein n=1 Tax=Sorangium sp. So ce1078 TaxID=3133329 RepID=UPI003F62B501
MRILNAPGWNVLLLLCLPLAACGGGAEVDPLTCGPGTRNQAGQCVPEATDGDVVCGPGTTLEEGVCVPQEQGDVLSCGPGTEEVEGQCVPVATSGEGGRYQLLVGVSEISADGLSKVPVLALGADEDGAPLSDAVIVKPSRADAGTVWPASSVLGALGAQVYFTPCNGTTSPDCLGDFDLTLALASDPDRIVARSRPLTLVEPMGVGSPAPCLVGGNVLFFDGEAGDYIHPGTDTIRLGEWAMSFSQFRAELRVEPASQEQGSWWTIDLSTEELDVPLGPGRAAQGSTSAGTVEGATSSAAASRSTSSPSKAPTCTP